MQQQIEPTPIVVRTESGPLDLEFLGFASTSAFDQAAGYVGASLEFACRWHLHRETIDRFAEHFGKIVEEKTKIKRGIDKTATERRQQQATKKTEVTPILESFPRYMKRVFSKLGDSDRAELKALALIESRQFQIDVTPVERKTTIDAVYYRRADSMLDKYDTETLNLKVEEFGQVSPRFKPDFGPDGRISRESLAMLLYKYDEAAWAAQD